MTRGEGFADGSRARRGREKLEGWVPIIERPRQELSTEQLQVIINWKSQRLVMQMFQRRCSVTPCHHTETMILHRLQLLEVSLLEIGREDGGRVVKH